MAVVAVGSLHGSPGATTVALDLANTLASDTLLIEADPDGGCLAARLGLATRPGLTELAGAARTGIAADDLWRFAQPSGRGAAIVASHPSPEQVQAALRAAAHHIAVALRRVDQHVIVDIGRFRPGSPALAAVAVAQTLIVVCANNLESIVALTHRTLALRTAAGDHDKLTIVMSSAKPYRITDIEAATGINVWGVVPSAAGRRSAARRAIALARLSRGCFPPAAQSTDLGGGLDAAPRWAETRR